ncbi:MAG: aminoacyl-histidine dipeptidase, partial [Candidatus Saliniplasma sp.]
MENLDPKEVWNYFEEITKIPRCSGEEEKVREFVRSVAEEKGYEIDIDDVGNILVKKPGTIKNAPPLVIQSHLDMVCEKTSESNHDFSEDPITMRKENGWITADGTTLGADNGIGVAISLAMMTDDELTHGPLEFLFTVEEETGLTGAKGLEPEFFDGRTLINLDSEQFGSFTIGCAGSGDSTLKLPVEHKKIDDGNLFEIKLNGFKGGHSGLDIGKGRENANKVLSRLLYEAVKVVDSSGGDLSILDIEGGSKRNTIPKESKAVIRIDDQTEKVKEHIKDVFTKIKEECSAVEKDVRLDIHSYELNGEKQIKKEDSKKIVELIEALPNGVQSMSKEVPDLVKTSTNLATISLENDNFVITMMTRSSSEFELTATRDKIKITAERFGCEVEETEAYPGWQPNLGSDILQISKDTYKKNFGGEAKIEALHAGLETGIIGENFEDMDMISFGATLEGAHTPEEKVDIKSVENTWKLLTNICEEFATK